MADKQPGDPAPELATAAEEGTAAPEPSLPAAIDATAEDPIYVSKREVRKNAGKGTSKKSTYFLEFYLVDNHGYETLAATGEDQGTKRSFLVSRKAIPYCFNIQLIKGLLTKQTPTQVLSVAAF